MKIIIFSSTGGKAFSVGGDVKSLYMDGIDQNSDKWLLNNFFVDEHTLDYYMSKIKVLIYVISKLKYQSGMEWLWDKV